MIKDCICICPIYIDILNNDEIISLNRFVQLMYYKDIVFVVPNKLNIDNFLKNINLENQEKYLKYHDEFTFEYFNDEWFESNHTYSALLLTLDFYYRFSEKYRYMFMYQLDAFIFENKLDYYLSKNYNFIGAYEGPLFHYPPLFDYFNHNNFHNYINGGFNLRNIEYCINTINSKFDLVNYIIENKDHYTIAEDQFFSESLNQPIELNDLLNFSLSDSFGDIIFGLTHHYPFGCHGYNRSDFLMELINKFINEQHLY